METYSIYEVYFKDLCFCEVSLRHENYILAKPEALVITCDDCDANVPDDALALRGHAMALDTDGYVSACAIHSVFWAFKALHGKLHGYKHSNII